ncbi:C25 family cysteine peptidase [Flavobacterium sp.]|uniref:C25 family cysteine peptidase n=1 Tax=Flavobacterium sp. TaxID=239 RepID=UPI003752F749
MKKSITLLLLILAFTMFGQNKQLVKLNSNEDKLEFKDKNFDGIDVFFSIKDIDVKEILTANEKFITISNKNLAQIYNTRMPNIPVISKLIEAPQGAEIEFVIKSFDEQIIKLSDYGINYKIAPARRSQSKSEGEVAFEKDIKTYKYDSYFNTDIIKYINSGQLRSTKIGRIEIQPIQYNPVQNSLRILNNLVIEIRFVNSDIKKTKLLKEKYGNSVIDKNLNNNLLNNLNGVATNVSQSPIHMVIVSDRMFQTQLIPFIAWKIKKGFKITVAYTDVIGTTTTAIKSYLQNIYNGTEPMNYVLLVGDVQQIPSFDGNAGTHKTDLRYCEYTGDNLPEVFYGRFSAQNTAQLQPQIDKTLMYEKYLMPNPSYLSEVLLVAGDDAVMEMTYGNGQLQYGNDYYFKESNNVNNNMYLQPLDNALMHSTIINKVNTGVSFANYTAHCNSDGWGSPSFSVSDMSSLNNNGKYGLWIGSCCQSNTFANDECFGEAALRKVNGGAIGYIGGSNNTYWSEDYWWGVGNTTSITANPTYEGSSRGMYDAYWHQLSNETNTNSWYTTQGEMLVSGNIAVEGSTTSATNKEYYWEIYHLMGDPSVTNYIGTPQPMSVTLNPVALLIGMTTLSVNAAPYSYVALSQNGVLIKSAFSGSNGVAVLNFNANSVIVGTADIVVTAQNKVPYISTITIAPDNRPFVVLNSYTSSVPTNFGQTVSLNVKLENVAASGTGYNANAVNATISTTSNLVTITDATENYNTINAAQSVLRNNAFTFSIPNNIVDGQTVKFDLIFTDNSGNSWNGTINVVLNAPKFKIPTTIIINDSTGNNDGLLDPGETATISIQCSNIGHAPVSNVKSSINSISNYLTINSVNTVPIILGVNQNNTFVFNVTASTSAPRGSVSNLNYLLTGGNSNQYSSNQVFPLTIGFVPVYCNGEGTNTTDEYIKQVVINTINNSSTQGPSYSNFSSIITNVTLGQSYPITIINGKHFSPDTMGCWVDWNRDGDFNDANENIAISYSGTNGSIGTGTGTITIPANANNGYSRLRTRIHYGSGMQSCGTSDYGEVEDYTLNVSTSLNTTEFSEIKFSLYPNPTNGNFTINLDSVLNSDAGLEIYSINGQLIFKKEIKNTIEDINFNASAGIYFVKVTNDFITTIKKIILK